MKLFYGISAPYERAHRLLATFRLDESTRRALQVLEIAVDLENVKEIDHELALLKAEGFVPAEGVDLDTTVLIGDDAPPMPPLKQLRVNELEMDRRRLTSVTSFELDPMEVVSARELFSKLLIQLGSFYSLSIFPKDGSMREILFALEIQKVDPYVVSKVSVPAEFERRIEAFVTRTMSGLPPAAVYLVPV